MDKEHDAAVDAGLRLPLELEIEVCELGVGHDVGKVGARVLVGLFQLNGTADYGPVATSFLLKVRVPSLQIVPVEEQLPSVLLLLRCKGIRFLRQRDVSEQNANCRGHRQLSTVHHYTPTEVCLRDAYVRRW